eukprot:Rmarinus@m.11153
MPIKNLLLTFALYFNVFCICAGFLHSNETSSHFCLWKTHFVDISHSSGKSQERYWCDEPQPEMTLAEDDLQHAMAGLENLDNLLVDDRTIWLRGSEKGLALLREGFEFVGFSVVHTNGEATEYPEQETNPWTILWSWRSPFGNDGFIKPSNIEENQVINHIPGIGVLGIKSALWKLGKKHNFDFLPKTYTLPDDLNGVPEEEFLNKIWLTKSDGHRNVKIADLSYRKARMLLTNNPLYGGSGTIIQAFIDNPLLIGGHKWDMGVYVLIESIDPLVVYIYDDVLLRFCKLKYPSLNELRVGEAEERSYVISEYISAWNVPALRRYYNPEYPGLRYTMTGRPRSKSVLAAYLEGQQKDFKKFWKSVEQVVFDSVAGAVPAIKQKMSKYKDGSKHFFEFLRFDVLVDEDMKCWLLEVNMSPNQVPKKSDGDADVDWRREMVSALVDQITDSKLSATGTPFRHDDFLLLYDGRQQAGPKKRRPTLSRPTSSGKSTGSLEAPSGVVTPKTTESG